MVVDHSPVIIHKKERIMLMLHKIVLGEVLLSSEKLVLCNRSQIHCQSEIGLQGKLFLFCQLIFGPEFIEARH